MQIFGWPDEARRLIQQPLFEALTANRPLKGRCLNCGSGEGLYNRFVESFGGVTSIVNVDLEEPGIVSSDPRHTAVQGSITDLPFEAGSFDSILCTEVIEHVPDDDRAASELSRVLTPGGVALISTPLRPAPFDPEHAREGYTVGELKDLLGRHGFAVRDQRVCFHRFMRLLMVTWRWQSVRFGRNWFPRPLLLALGWLDRTLRIGKPWDVIVIAEKQ